MSNKDLLSEENQELKDNQATSENEQGTEIVENIDEKQDISAENSITENDNSGSNTENQPSIEEKLSALNDKYLRLSAEFDNYKKRTLKERMELIKSAGEDIFLNFLPVINNLERAKKSIDEAKDIIPVKEGIDLIFKSMFDFLSQRGLKEIEAHGKEFDTDLHEALTKIPASEESMKGKVIDVIEKGYTLNGKVIRFAKVVVGE